MDRLTDDALSIPPIARRTFVTTLVAGFALAAGPASADAIITDTNGLDAGAVDVPVSDGKIPAYRARPSGKTKLPVVLVIQEIFGVHEHIKDLCRRLAHQGYYAIAPSLYARQGDPGKYDMAHVMDMMKDIVAKVPDAEVMTDLDSTVAFAKSEGADTARLAITGFCWGGRIVWLYAAHNHDLKAGVAWYGPLAGTDNDLRPHTAIELAADVKAPVLGLYAGLDTNIHQADIDAMQAALKASGNTVSHIDVFPDAQHGFNADYRPSYNEKDAKEGWSRMLAWFKANGI
ncbi:MAG TPA: dienelactone hydrolase family protein [Rhizomicrobium sp.]|jgi:carboxymethylenebutenolidase|nr:dienelactone hydrolase family protein [Rhizomicrobium sp.]